LATDADDALLLLDLPDLVLDRMLEELFPVSLAAMACIGGSQGQLLHGQPLGAPRRKLGRGGELAETIVRGASTGQAIKKIA
jgi:hypothetical protein